MKIKGKFSPIAVVIESEEELWVLRHLMAMDKDSNLSTWLFSDNDDVNLEKVEQVRNAFCKAFEDYFDKEFTEHIPEGLKCISANSSGKCKNQNG